MCCHGGVLLWGWAGACGPMSRGQGPHTSHGRGSMDATLPNRPGLDLRLLEEEKHQLHVSALTQRWRSESSPAFVSGSISLTVKKKNRPSRPSLYLLIRTDRTKRSRMIVKYLCGHCVMSGPNRGTMPRLFGKHS